MPDERLQQLADAARVPAERRGQVGITQAGGHQFGGRERAIDHAGQLDHERVALLAMQSGQFGFEVTNANLDVVSGAGRGREAATAASGAGTTARTVFTGAPSAIAPRAPRASSYG